MNELKNTVGFTIYQVKLDKTRDYGFISFDLLISEYKEVNMSVYDEVYKGSINTENKTVIRMLESLFSEFNINHPTDYRGRSMSVSDIVELNGEYYYCDIFGFEKIEDSLLKRL